MTTERAATAVAPDWHITDRAVSQKFPYRIYGLRVVSDIVLPVAPPEAVEAQGMPDVVFRRAAPGQEPPSPDGPIVEEFICNEPCHNGTVVTRVHRGPGGAWIWNHQIGTCHVHPGARIVDVYPDPAADDATVGVLLATQVSVFVLHRFGWPVLHASAVDTEHGAVAFLGPKGHGKSTMVLSFVQRGAVLLSDDVTPLLLKEDSVHAIPSCPSIRMWADTAENALGTEHNLPDLAPGYLKKILHAAGRYQFTPAPARLNRLYMLDRYGKGDPRSGVTITELSPRESVLTLLGQVPFGAFLHPHEAAQLLTLYGRIVNSVPVLRLGFPSGFEHQESIYAHIVADLAESTKTKRAGSHF